MDLVTPAYRAAAGLARAAPEPVAAAAARGLGRAAAHIARDRRAQVERNLRRIVPELSQRERRRLVEETFASYARKNEESIRLPGTSAADQDRGYQPDGWELIDEALVDGNGAIQAMPHLGLWECSGF
jgi:KDO2-lipid IV(A) lauroyltransferase